MPRVQSSGISRAGAHGYGTHGGNAHRDQLGAMDPSTDERDTLQTKFRSAMRHIREWMAWALRRLPGTPTPTLPPELVDEVYEPQDPAPALPTVLVPRGRRTPPVPKRSRGRFSRIELSIPSECRKFERELRDI